MPLNQRVFSPGLPVHVGQGCKQFYAFILFMFWYKS